MNGWGEQRGLCSPRGRVLRPGLKLESNKQRSKCHHVQMGYRVSGGINRAQRAARPGTPPVPGSWEVGFPEPRPKAPPDLGRCDKGPGKEPPARERGRESQTVKQRRAGLGGAGAGGGGAAELLQRIAPVKLPSLPIKQVPLFGPFTDEETEAESW